MDSLVYFSRVRGHVAELLCNCIITLGATIPKSATPYAYTAYRTRTLSADLRIYSGEFLYGVLIQGCHTHDAPDAKRNLAKSHSWRKVPGRWKNGLFPMWQCRRHSWRGRTITYSPVCAAICDSEVFFPGSGTSV